MSGDRDSELADNDNAPPQVTPLTARQFRWTGLGFVCIGLLAFFAGDADVLGVVSLVACCTMGGFLAALPTLRLRLANPVFPRRRPSNQPHDDMETQHRSRP